MYHIPLAVQCIYGFSGGGEDGDGKEGSEILEDVKDCQASCMQMIWFYMVSRRRT